MTSQKKARKKDDSFEEIYSRLEITVAKMDQGGLSLDESLDLYEEGMKLVKQCQELLNKAEQRINVLEAEDLANQPSVDMMNEGSE